MTQESASSAYDGKWCPGLSGRVTTRQECPDCGGDGYSDPREACPTCGPEARVARTCQTCDGTGNTGGAKCVVCDRYGCPGTLTSEGDCCPYYEEKR